LRQAMSDDHPLTPDQRDDLRAIAGIIIPASAEFDVPGADDPAIQADIAATLGRDATLVRETLNELTRIAGAPLATLELARRAAARAAEASRSTSGAAAREAQGIRNKPLTLFNS